MKKNSRKYVPCYFQIFENTFVTCRKARFSQIYFTCTCDFKMFNLCLFFSNVVFACEIIYIIMFNICETENRNKTHDDVVLSKNFDYVNYRKL